MPKPGKIGVRGLYRDADGRFTIDLRWKDRQTGKRQRYSEQLPRGVKAAAAKERAREILNGALGGTFDPRKVANEPKTLHEAIDAYLVWSETNRPRSMQTRRTQAKQLKEHMGNPRLSALSPFALEKFKRDRIAALLPRPRAEYTDEEYKVEATKHGASVNRALALFKHMVKLTKGWGWISPDLAASLREVELVDEPAGRVRCLTAEEQNKIESAMSVGLRAVMVAATLSGMRRAEVLLLRKNAVNLASREITLTLTKNGRTRTVQINERLAAILEPRLATPGEYVFAKPNGEPYRVDTLSRAFCRAARKAGVKDARFHDTRHSYATRLRRKGVGIDVLQDLGGWSSLEMVRRYAHVGKDELHAAVRKLDEVASPLPDTAEAKTEKDNVVPIVIPRSS